MKIIICSSCDGIGKLWEAIFQDCHPADRIPSYERVICGRCKGTGRLIKRITFEPYNEESCSK